MRAGGRIDIAMAFDDGFWAPAYAAMRSVCLTSRRPEALCFHIFHPGLAEDHLAVLRTLAAEHGARLDFTDLGQSDLLSARVAAFPHIRMKRFRPIIYARLFLGELLDPGLERVLYLDADTFVRNPIEDLFDIDMQGKVVAAVRQPDRMHCIAGRDLRARKAFSMAEPYFNSGVLLIDLEQFRQVDFEAALVPSLPAAEIAQLYYDQDILNFVLRGRFLDLDPRWNLQNPEPAHEAFDPHILHYSADSRPWYPWARVAFKQTYRHLMTNEFYYRYQRERLLRRVRRWLRLT